MASYDVGGLFGETIRYNNFTVIPSQPLDIFAFTIYFDVREVTLNLHDISLNDNANITLWADQNGNGIYDNADTLLGFSTESGNADDVINFMASPGTYFARVNRDSNSIGNVTYDLDLSAHYNVGSLGVTPERYTEYLSTGGKLQEVYEFAIAGTSYIHLTLDNWWDGESDLRLYQDNGNGFFDDEDTLVVASTEGDRYESIDYKGSGGTYFTEVDYVNSGLIGTVDYNLTMSATFGFTKVSNLVVGEVNLGDITYNTPDQTGTLGDLNTTETYAFSLELYEAVNIKLTDLTSDANLSLVRDINKNGIVDAGEVVNVSYNSGSSDEQMYVHESGKYFLMAHQATFGGETAYTLEFDHYTTPYP